MPFTRVLLGTLLLVGGHGCSDRTPNSHTADAIGNGDRQPVPDGASDVVPDVGPGRQEFLAGMAAAFCDAITPCCQRFGLDNDAEACRQDATIAVGWVFPGALLFKSAAQPATA